MGGPESLSRDQFAEKVAKTLNLSTKSILPIPRKKCKEPWAHHVQNPQNLAMDVSKLEKVVDFKFMGIEEYLKKFGEKLLIQKEK